METHMISCENVRDFTNTSQLAAKHIILLATDWPATEQFANK